MTATATTPNTNWQNPSNWHWRGKSVGPWAQHYISSRLTPITVRVGEDWTLNVNPTIKVTGDCELHNRKSKLITIYDLEIKVPFIATQQGQEGGVTRLEGTCEIKDFMHDATLKELDISLTCPKAPSSLQHQFKATLSAALFEALTTFSVDLIDAHKQDVYIEAHAMKGHPTLATYQPKPPVSQEVNKTTESSVPSTDTTAVKGSLVTITQSVEFVASAQDLFACFTDPARLAAWTRGPVVAPTAGPGAPFALFDGNITGQLVEQVPGERLVWTWRQRSWTPNHHSRVVLTFTQGQDSTTIALTQSAVPVGEKSVTEANWHQYYWNPIKATFGYGAQF